MAFPSKTNYLSGDVLTAAQMNDIGSEINALNGTAGKNKIINSDFSIWQRGTSVGAAGSQFAADRWNFYRAGYAAGITVSRQVTGDTTNLPFIQYCARVQRDSGNTSTAAMLINNNLETVNSIPFAGKTVTISFYARRGANYSSGSNFLVATLTSGTGTDQALRNGLTGQSTPITTSVTLSTTWQRFTATGNVPSTATQLVMGFSYNPGGTAGAADYFEVTGVQLESGNLATDFQTATGTLAGELAACQRYYWRATVSATGQKLGVANVESTTTSDCMISFPVTMRINPTALETSGTAGDYSVRSGGAATVCNAVPTFLSASTSIGHFQALVASGLTAGYSGSIRAASANAYLGWSAEL